MKARKALPATILGALILGVAPWACASVLDEVLATKTLKVCIWPDYFGITYRNPKTEQLSGIDIDLSAAFARDLGVRLEYVDSSFSNLIADVETGRCHVAMFGVGITPARSEKLAFTSPYLASGIYAITTRTNRRIRSWADIDQDGAVVVVARGTFHEQVMRDKLAHARLLVVDTPFAREQELRSGRADVLMTDYPYSRRLMANADWARLIAAPDGYFQTSYAYALRQRDPQWLERVEKFVRQIKRDGRLRAAAEKNDLLPILVK